MIIIRRCKMLTLTLLLIGDHPKRRKDSTKAAIEASLLALEDDTPAACMTFPPWLALFMLVHA